MGITIPFVVGKKRWARKPEDKEIPIFCQTINNYVVRQASIAEAYTYITEGRCWRAGILKEGAKGLTKDNFKSSHIFALDFDKCELLPDEIAEYCESISIPLNFWYWSFSQGKKPKNNFRVVWVFDSEISAEQYEELYKAVLQDQMFKDADKATKDISRLWFGTDKGGSLLSEEPIKYSNFDIFVRTEEVSEKAGEKRTRFYQGKTAQDFIMEKEDFDWDNYLCGVCDLWDSWRQKKYLHYSQRLLLFTELKCLKYAEGLKISILDKVMSYYDAELYKGSKCSVYEISYFMSSKTSDKVGNPIVNFNGNRYTISEYFNSGVYLEKIKNHAGERQSREQLQEQADRIIPEVLAADGINYVECQTEAGKTERIIRFLCGIDFSQDKIIYSVPTYKLINEFIDRLRKAGFNMDYIHYPRKVDYNEEDLALLDAGFPDSVKMTPEMLERKKELQKINDKDVKGLFLITHSCLIHLRAFDVSEVIIDENIEDLVIDRKQIPLARLYGLKAFLTTTESKTELDKLCNIIDEKDPQEEITGIDRDKIFKGIDIGRLIHSNAFRNDEGTMYPIGKFKFADKISIGADRFGNKYLYFETMSKLFPLAIEKGIKVKLFTGTPKIEQLKTGLPPEIADIIIANKIVIMRARPLGHIKQFARFKGSKTSLSRDKVWTDIEKELEKQGVDWRNTNTLTLKSYVKKASDEGFKIPKTIDGEIMYIENCAGLDCLKGQDLIVIGKADMPKENYLDMTGGKIKDKSTTTRARIIEGVPGTHKIYGFNNNELWELQANQIRLFTEQAVARARTLWNDVNVYVFSDYPVRDTEPDEIETIY